MEKFSRIGRSRARALSLSAALLFGCAAFGADWVNLDEPHHVGGRMTSSGYMQGKVVLVDCRDYGGAGADEVARRMQSIWTSFKSKPFVLLGSHRGTNNVAAARAVLKKAGVTYPVYESGAIAGKEPASTADAYFYIVDATGRARFVNRDEHRTAESLVNWLANADSPPTEKILRQVVEFENAVLPGRAYLRLEELRQSDPMLAEPFEDQWQALKGDEDVQKAAKLEKFARQAREADPAAKGKRRVSVEKLDRIIAYFEPMTRCGRAEIEQEVKNCIADLVWTKADVAAANGGEM